MEGTRAAPPSLSIATSPTHSRPQPQLTSADVNSSSLHVPLMQTPHPPSLSVAFFPATEAVSSFTASASPRAPAVLASVGAPGCNAVSVASPAVALSASRAAELARLEGDLADRGIGGPLSSAVLRRRGSAIPLSREAEAAVRLQRWYRSLARRRRFLAMVNRARRRRKFLDGRRQAAQRLHTNETEAEEMRARLALPGGAQLVSRWQDARTADAALKVQSVYRTWKAKAARRALQKQRDTEHAARLMQAFWRKRAQRGRPNPLSQAMQTAPFSSVVTPERLLKVEERILNQKKQFHVSRNQGLSAEELKKRSVARYQDFVEHLPRHRRDMLLALTMKVQAREMVRALEGRSWDRPPPFGLCSSVLVRDAENKHKERKASIARDLGASGNDVYVYIESRAEELEANDVLRTLEKELGYDFSLVERELGYDI